MKNIQRLSTFLIVACLLALPGCGGSGGSGQTAGEPFRWNLPAGFPEPAVPADNPMTPAKVELGRHLFYDPRLSGNGTQSCSDCHLQEKAFTDGNIVSTGSTGDPGVRNAPTLVNVAYRVALTWPNPVLTVLERQVVVPMFGEFPVEMGITDGNKESVLARFRSEASYRDLFARSFPGEADPVSFNNIVKALSAFNRSIISADSPYDRFVQTGNPAALSDAALRGKDLFFGRAGCFHCHGGPNLDRSDLDPSLPWTDRSYHNIGLYNLNGTGNYPGNNMGVFEISGRPPDMGKFLTPSLRNVALTAPYMHDGSVATLEEAVRIFAEGGRVIPTGPYAGDGRSNPWKSGLITGFAATDGEIADLVAFLNSLTDNAVLTDPRFSNPFH